MIVHIAGGILRVGTQMRQRCGWCGAVLLDIDLAHVMVPEGQSREPAAFEPGVLVAVEVEAGAGHTGPRPVHQYVVPHVDGDRLPPEACGQLPHEVTA